MRINHLNLRVASVARSRDFYVTHFGLAEYVWHGDVLFLRDAAGMDFGLMADGPPVPSDTFHFGFRLETPEAVTAAHARLAAAGVSITEPLTDEGDLRYFRCADPDGYAIEVYWEPQPA